MNMKSSDKMNKKKKVRRSTINEKCLERFVF